MQLDVGSEPTFRLAYVTWINLNFGKVNWGQFWSIWMYWNGGGHQQLSVIWPPYVLNLCGSAFLLISVLARIWKLVVFFGIQRECDRDMRQCDFVQSVLHNPIPKSTLKNIGRSWSYNYLVKVGRDWSTFVKRCFGSRLLWWPISKGSSANNLTSFDQLIFLSTTFINPS